MEILNKLLAINPNFIIIGLITVFYSLEQILNTQFKFGRRPQHLFHNILFQLVFILLNLLWAIATVYSIEWINKNEIGLFYLVQVPVWLKLLLGIAMFDFVSYWFHRIAHITPVLWRFHRVHHSDTTMDASTTFRGHPVEATLYFGTANILAAAIFGLDLLALGVYFLALIPFLFIEHSNLRFSKWLDKTVGLVITTPNIHKVHHEQDQLYTDSNFSDIFILWDRIFGTFKYKPPEAIKFGLKEFEGARKQTFWYLMISPFINMGRVSSGELKKDK
jgi:sterol desaturase/sphingolipid hydroxylase (fatty acid hydroxylase superfamily)